MWHGRSHVASAFAHHCQSPACFRRSASDSLTTSVGGQMLQIESHPMEVTSDTPAYCLHLLDRVSEMIRMASAPVPMEVTNLTTEGQRMCAHGQTRSGIMRLRSAVMIMEKNNGPAYR